MVGLQCPVGIMGAHIFPLYLHGPLDLLTPVHRSDTWLQNRIRASSKVRRSNPNQSN